MAVSFIRTVILFFLIMVAMRIMGKRQMGELEPTEFVVAVLISDLAANPLQDMGTPLLYGIIPVLTLISCEILISGLILKNIKVRSIICGKPSIIINNGVLNQKEMKKNRFTIDELMVELRKQSITKPDTIKHAILETDGSLSVLLYPEFAPITPHQLNIKPENDEYPVIIINDGRVLHNNLITIGLSDGWLNAELKRRKIRDANEVFIMTVTADKKIFCLKKDEIK